VFFNITALLAFFLKKDSVHLKSLKEMRYT
ncbi:unnamed protein product, partial [marine sediment metagenome]